MNAIDRMKRYTEIASRAGSGATEVDYVTIRDVLDELDRLRAIVDRLPKTADGVPIYPGMTVWNSGLHAGTCEQIGGLSPYTEDYSKSQWMSGEIDSDRVYSTREAAEKARNP